MSALTGYSLLILAILLWFFGLGAMERRGGYAIELYVVATLIAAAVAGCF